MSQLVEEVLARFEERLSCSQSVFSTYAPHFGVDREAALRLASPFGGGIAGTGNTCGAVTGALMVLGLAFGQTDPTDKARKEEMREIGCRFLADFAAAHGSVLCRDLLGVDMSTPEGLAQARGQNLFHTTCPVFVATAAALLEQRLFS